MGELVASRNHCDVLGAIGLGSCIGLALIDTRSGVPEFRSKRNTSFLPNVSPGIRFEASDQKSTNLVPTSGDTASGNELPSGSTPPVRPTTFTSFTTAPCVRSRRYTPIRGGSTSGFSPKLKSEVA